MSYHSSKRTRETLEQISEDPYPLNLARSLYRSFGIEPEQYEIDRAAEVLDGWTCELRPPMGFVIRCRYGRMLSFKETQTALKDLTGCERSLAAFRRIYDNAMFELARRIRSEFIEKEEKPDENWN